MKIPLTQADNSVTTSCDYPLAAGNLDCGDVNISPTAYKLLKQYFASDSPHHPPSVFEADAELPGGIYFQIRNEDQFRGQLAVKC